MAAVEEQCAAFQEHFTQLKQEISKVFIGHATLVEQLLISLFSQGHVLLEGVPGLGKTLLVKTLSEVLSLRFARIQCTPDLMPADIIGTNVFLPDAQGDDVFKFQSGPLFANLVLADEINRATPKTQSAFLEAMQEHKVTILGTTHSLVPPFLVLATQNPLEMEGTYPLPEAQLDRFFFKLVVPFPAIDDLSRIMDLTTTAENPDVNPVCDQEQLLQIMALVKQVKIAEEVKRYALRLMLATHPSSPEATDTVQQFVRHGASPRAAQSMILGGKVKALISGRYNVSYDDLRDMAAPSLHHRILFNFEAEFAKLSAEAFVQEILASITP